MGDASIREGAFTKLQDVIKGGKLTLPHDMMFIWNGLNHCLQMSDKPSVIKNKLGELILLFSDLDESLAFINCGLQTLVGTGDAQSIRIACFCLFHCMFAFIKAKDWDVNAIKAINKGSGINTFLTSADPMITAEVKAQFSKIY